jgi:hypothetical protein
MSIRRAALAALALLALTAPAAQARVVSIGEFTLSNAKLNQLRSDWISQLQTKYGNHTWAPMKFDLGDKDLKLMGLPSKKVLTSHRYKTPTAVVGGKLVPLPKLDQYLAAKAGKKGGGGKKPGGGGSVTADGPSLVSFAGTGWFGIRPGAWLLTVTDAEVGWCSMAQVYGSPGSYSISTAGHCGKAGDWGTVIGVVGNKTFDGAPIPVLIDFGQYSRSTGDAGIGKDWALIGVNSTWQNLVSPTMAFWGGPRGIFTSVGQIVSGDLTKGSIATNPNPTLAQGLLHYGHGAGIGAGGTPRAGTSIAFFTDRFVFFGAITPGDSGSGSDVLTGDNLGDEREAAGINTHIYVDASLKTGVGYLAGTRATQVGATMANGQLIPIPVPESITP